MSGRLVKFVTALGGLGVDLAIVTPGPNFRYLVGSYIETFERFGALIVCANNGSYSLVLPRLDEGKARATGIPYIVYGDDEGPIKAVDSFIRGCGKVGRVGFESRASMSYLWLMRRVVGNFEDVPLDDVFTQLRISKDGEELGSIERAVRAIEEGIRAAHESIRPGMTEVEIARVIGEAISNAGAEPRDVLVQSGPNSAIPHWTPSRRRVDRGDIVVVDVTATYNDYYGDLTRTFVIGETPSGFWEVYRLVKSAHDEAIGAVREGVTGAYVDSVARGVINSGGYGDYFIHRTGHGIGLEVHEEPFIGQSYNKPLLRGSVFTIEPGIYLQGRFGVRLESNVVLMGDGSVKVLDRLWQEVIIGI
ncbi:peptidase M24 [Vulcanisaeta sp. EB80]|uniref:M24 family metallopeptidase n=1 Tax=Vulcanisaeta sp. EB80 TaxID=1650660 RepID=UPI0009C138ED|nr:Xaa-Pro peptidase family protein [Vulcanisaeta sp. EB80]PLC68072.1 peptidase M24 [Vulcanisaeta sp. EB80]